MFLSGIGASVVVSPSMSPSYALSLSHKLEPCESYAQHEKIDRYADAFVHSDYFAPVIFETSGALRKGKLSSNRLFGLPRNGRGSLTQSLSLVPGEAFMLCTSSLSSANFESR